MIAEAQPVFTTSPGLIRARVMDWVCSHETPGDTESIARAIAAPVGGTNAALWALRRHDLVTFRERKGSSHGHGSGTSYAERVSVTEKGRKSWDQHGAESRTNREYIEGTFMQASEDIREIAGEIIVANIDDTPPAPPDTTRADSLAWWLKRQPERKGRIRDYNHWAGLKPDAVQVYQLCERCPEAFVLTEPKGTVSFIGPDDWYFQPKPKGGAARQDVAQMRHVEQTLANTTLPLLGPAILELQGRAAKRAKVTQAMELLASAGLDEEAINLLDRVATDTPLEVEVLDLVNALGYPRE